MRTIILLASVALVSACAAPHAAKVRCDRHLVPINSPAPTLAGRPPSDPAKDPPRGSAP